MEDFDNSVVFVLGGLVSGGAERVASRLINYWHQKGWAITLIVGHKRDKDFYSVPKDLNRMLVSNGSPSGNKVIALLKNIPIVWNLRKALKKTESQTVISFLTRTNIYTILACMGLNKRVIVSERNDTTREEHPWPWPLLRKVFYKYADVVTANSEIALSGMQGYVDKEKLKIVPNPVDIPSISARPEKSKTIINVGRLVSQKAQHLIIEAMCLIDDGKRTGWRLDIFGVGEEEKKLKSLVIGNNLSWSVKLRGLVKDIEKVYQDAGIFVLSSRYEGTPNALLEAMSFGLPCIISDTIPGAESLIDDGETGLIFSSSNAEDLAQKMLSLMENPELRKRLGQNARKRVEIYSPKNVMPVWDNLLFGGSAGK